MELEFAYSLNGTILLSGFVLGLFIGVVTDLINKFVLAFVRWVSSW